MAIIRDIRHCFGNAKNRFPRFLSGDTLIEVMFAVGIFGIVAVSAISLMNRGLQNAQGNLEVTMSRQEIDGQAESLRFLHDAYIAEKSIENSRYSKVWEAIMNKAYTTDELLAEVPSFYSEYSGNTHSCSELYEKLPANSFIINPRSLGSSDVKNIVDGVGNATVADIIISRNAADPDDKNIRETATYPRLLFGDNEAQVNSNNMSDATATTVNYNKKLYSAEGIWVTAVKSSSGTNCATGNCEFRPDYYDFYIRTCWNSPDGGSYNTIGSTIRLFNPD